MPNKIAQQINNTGFCNQLLAIVDGKDIPGNLVYDELNDTPPDEVPLDRARPYFDERLYEAIRNRQEQGASVRIQRIETWIPVENYSDGHGNMRCSQCRQVSQFVNREERNKELHVTFYCPTHGEFVRILDRK